MKHNPPSQRPNYFQSIHKAIRRLLFLMSMELGCIDFTCDEALKELSAQFHALKSFLKTHAEQEDNYFLPIIQQHLSQEAKAMAESHPEFEAKFEEMTDRFEAILQMDAPVTRLNHGYLLYIEFNHFIAEYLAHLHHEEAVIMPLLWQKLDDKALFEPLQAFLSNMSKEDFETSLSHMMPAISPQEKSKISPSA